MIYFLSEGPVPETQTPVAKVSNFSETLKLTTILLFILLFAVSRSPQSERISAFTAAKGLVRIGVGGSQIMGLGCQIGSKSFL